MAGREQLCFAPPSKQQEVSAHLPASLSLPFPCPNVTRLFARSLAQAKTLSKLRCEQGCCICQAERRQAGRRQQRSSESRLPLLFDCGTFLSSCECVRGFLRACVCVYQRLLTLLLSCAEPVRPAVRARALAQRPAHQNVRHHSTLGLFAARPPLGRLLPTPTPSRRNCQVTNALPRGGRGIRSGRECVRKLRLAPWPWCRLVFPLDHVTDDASAFPVLHHCTLSSICLA